MCVVSVLLVVLAVLAQLQEVTACAPLSSQREQNYKRSPYSGYSNDVRHVNLTAYIGGEGTPTYSGAYGVRPALFSEGTEL